jgi:hypothetical protein
MARVPPIYRTERLAALELIEKRRMLERDIPLHLRTALYYLAQWKLVRDASGFELTGRGREIMQEWRVERFAKGEDDV